MKVCLISPPTVTEFSDRLIAESEALSLMAQHAPMGILSLAAVLEQLGIEVEIIDLNRLYHKYMNCGRPSGMDFCAYTNWALESLVADVFGFSTICSTYPLTLRMAQGFRLRHPEAWIILGGPQASVVDVRTLQTFGAVDLIVRGEAEQSFPEVLESIFSHDGRLEQIKGITFRQRGKIIRNPNAPVIEDLDSLPPAAFHLYPHIADCAYAPVEAGRGCPFACSFCSTNDFFRRRFRMKSPRVLVSQMQEIKRTYGIESFDLIHDMFTVDRKKVTAFCDAVEESGEKMYWSCSARTDCVDDGLIARMAATGCDGIFFGIDTGSETVQRAIQKHLDLTEAADRVKCANRHRIRTTVSLIIGFPEETRQDLRQTINFLGDSLRYQASDIQLHLLCPLPETPITSAYRDELVYDEIFSDISFQGWEQNPEECEMIKAHRDLFPSFYGVPTRWLERHYLRELREFLLHGALKHLWLIVLLHRDSNDLVSVFDEWLKWSSCERNSSGVVDSSRAYYASDSFSNDLLQFVETYYAPLVSRHPHLLDTMSQVERSQLRLGSHRTNHRLASSLRQHRITMNFDSVPVLPTDVHVKVVRADYKRLIRCLKRNARIDSIPEEQVSLVFARENDRIRITQVTPASHKLMSLCNGSRNIFEISAKVSEVEEGGISRQKAAFFGLQSLAQKGLIEFRSITT
jgi:radical SAM superfamily enzyme YgiQ (UPF0313 family)